MKFAWAPVSSLQFSSVLLIDSVLYQLVFSLLCLCLRRAHQLKLPTCHQLEN